ncbi:MAG: biopolymer transporter ExbD [Pseudomonadota bacterium]
MSQSHAAAATEESSHELNLTPMLDVVFIMLIFFIVTASFIRETAVEVYSPPGSTEPAEGDNITIKVMENHVFHINGRPLPRASVRPYLAQLMAEMPEASFAVLVAKYSELGDFVFVVDTARSLGISPVPVKELLEKRQ